MKNNGGIKTPSIYFEKETSINMKKYFLLANGFEVEMNFDDFFKEFELCIYSETNKMLKRHGSLFSRDEIEQQFTIELWEAFRKYDISLGCLASTYIYNRFRNAQKVLFNNNFSTKSNEFNNKQLSLNQIVSGDEEDGEFINGSFEYDDNYNLNNYNTQPEMVCERQTVYQILMSALKDESERDLFVTLSDRVEYPISWYAEKHNISTRGAYKRLDKLIEKMKNVYNEAFAV